MLELFYFQKLSDEAKAKAEKEEKKKAAEEKKISPSKKPPPKPKEEKYPLEVKKPEKQSMKEQMGKVSTEEEKTLDLTQFPQEVVELYKLMLKLSEKVLRENNRTMPWGEKNNSP